MRHIVKVSFDEGEVDWAMDFDECEMKDESNYVKFISKTKSFFQVIFL